VDRKLFLKLRAARRLAFRGAALIDTPTNKLNGRGDWPPIWMRREVGPLPGFESTAVEIVTHLRYMAGLTPTNRFLDIGCGCGAVPLYLNMHAPYTGFYHGIDVNHGMIEWCNRHLANQHHRFSHFNYWSATYNPNGERMLPFPVDDQWAEVILMKSVFTHMLPPDVAWYLREVKRTLAAGGTALLTAVLYEKDDDVTRRFPHAGEHHRFIRPESPESSLALERAWIDREMGNVGLSYQYVPGVIQGTIYVRHAKTSQTPRCDDSSGSREAMSSLHVREGAARD
jgi:SAM-dependent methyltransferase